VSGPNVHTTVLLLAFAAGAGTSLAVALLAGGRVFSAMKRSLGAEEWIRRGLGVAVLIGVAAIATGADTGILRRISLASSSGFEQRLIDRLRPTSSDRSQSRSGAGLPALADEGPAPSFEGATGWLNTSPLTRQALSGKVVIVDFWTYSCINCLRSIPYVEAWARKYERDGLVVIGVHTPEFAFERDSANVARAVKDLGITYPVAIDSKYAIWNGFHNEYWPAHYFIDASGAIRSHHFGEGAYDEGEAVIRRLLEEKGTRLTDSAGAVHVVAMGSQAAADAPDIRSGETYVGYERTTNYASPEPIRPDEPRVYTAPSTLALNQWALGGAWNVSGEHAALIAAPGKVVFRFHARDLHLVLGPAVGGKPIRFRVKLDGAEPGSSHGVDVNAAGAGAVTDYRLYQLIRQPAPIQDHTFEIEFLDPGVQVFAFTFG
jgi:thiol-disulfide isomerase/thioredoxin